MSGHTKALLVVVSQAAAASEQVCREVSQALASELPMIAVRIDQTPLEEVDKALSFVPLASTSMDAEDPLPVDPKALRNSLAEMLPPLGPTNERGGEGIRIAWSEQVFSDFLREALARDDFNGTSALIGGFIRSLEQSASPYPQDPAKKDLGSLRKKRQFSQMKRYAEAVLSSGTTDFSVRRQYAQALIETGEFQRASEVLQRLGHDAPHDHPESYEARGLLGRTYKQQYVNEPEGAGAPELLRRAIEAYWSVFHEDPKHVWHGVNAATLMRRAAADAIAIPEPESPAEIASKILNELYRREEELRRSGEGKRMGVWDYATRVEALIVLNQYSEAQSALDEYLAHPDMEAFEVSSTHRQFEQVLRLNDNPSGREIMTALWHAVLRHRSGFSTRAGDATGHGTRITPMLVRVIDSEWTPGKGVPDLKIHAKLGTVLAISGTARTVRELLKDPAVVAVDKSRPGGEVECHRSVPFIRVAESYTMPSGNYGEKGSRALIAIIDNGIDVLHRAFRDKAEQPRIVAIWDQRDNTGIPPPGFDFGTLHDSAMIAAYVANNEVPYKLGRNVGGHGTHVASIAAGRAVGPFAGGVAPEASIAIVISASREAIGYSQSHVSALMWIDRLATARGLPVVVNVSQGMNSGAHDGRSMLEVAFDAFSGGGRTPGRVIVKSAGNERSKGTHVMKNGHAKVTVPEGGAERLRWKAASGLQYPSERLELWWNSANNYRFRLCGPSQDMSEWIDNQHPEQKGMLSSGPFALQFVKHHVDNGDSLLVVEIGGDGTPFAAGEWGLDIVAVKVPDEPDLHAWLERNGPSEFVNHPAEEMTLSVPGTAHTVVTVGAVEADEPIIVGDFSSYGPTRDGRRKPEVAAPGVNVQAARGGTYDEAMIMSGTSMAAPHVTGAIALLLSRQMRIAPGKPLPTATQISAALRQKTRNYSSRWDRGQGYGVIDVQGLLGAF